MRRWLFGKPDRPRADEDRIARERHLESLRASRRQTSFARKGVWIGIVTLVVTLVTSLLTRDDPQRPVTAAAPPAPGPETAEVTLGQDEGSFWLVPGTPAELGKPPTFVPDTEGLEEHCSDWSGWLRQRRAAPSGEASIQAAAEVSAPLTIVDVKVRVLRRYPSAATLVKCVYGAGGYRSAYGTVDLDAAAPAVTLEDERNGPLVIARGRDRFAVAPGDTEVIIVAPEGTPGFMYEWTMAVTYVVNAKTATKSFGTAAAPMRSYVRPPASDAPVLDWDPRTGRWIVVERCCGPAGLSAAGPGPAPTS